MANVTITTNHQWRDFVYRQDVPAKVLESDFDYLDSDESDGFFRYRGVWYHLSGFMRLDDNATDLAGWHAYSSDSAFSGVLIKVSNDGESVMVANYTS